LNADLNTDQPLQAPRAADCLPILVALNCEIYLGNSKNSTKLFLIDRAKSNSADKIGF
jgi:hypothetical protein